MSKKEVFTRIDENLYKKIKERGYKISELIELGFEYKEKRDKILSEENIRNILEELKSSGKLNKTFKYFEKKLKKFYKKHNDIFTDIVGIGLMRGLRVINSKILTKIIQQSTTNGVLVLKAGKSTLRFLPPLTITKDEIDKGFKRLNNVLKKI